MMDESEKMKQHVISSYKYLISTSRPRLFCNTVIKYVRLLSRKTINEVSLIDEPLLVLT